MAKAVLQLGAAAFSTYFSTTGTKFQGPYTLTSLIPAGSGAGLGSGAVPEPASLVLVLMGLASLGFGRRSRSIDVQQAMRIACL